MFGFEQFSLEMVLVLAVGLMILGPKDLPVVLRRLGQFVGKMRGMAAEFRASFDELARQSEIDELRKEVEALRTGNFSTPSTDPEPVSDYNPFDNASSGLDSAGFSFPPQPSTTEAPIMAEGLPSAAAEVVARPVRKRSKKASEPVAIEPAAPVKTARAKSATPKTPARAAPPPTEARPASKTVAPTKAAAKLKAAPTTAPKSTRAKSAAK